MIKFLIETILVVLFLSIIKNIFGEQTFLLNFLYGLLFLTFINKVSPVRYD